MERITAYYRVANINPSPKTRVTRYGTLVKKGGESKMPVFVGGNTYFGRVKVTKVSKLGSGMITICRPNGDLTKDKKGGCPGVLMFLP